MYYKLLMIFILLLLTNIMLQREGNSINCHILHWNSCKLFSFLYWNNKITFISFQRINLVKIEVLVQ